MKAEIHFTRGHAVRMRSDASASEVDLVWREARVGVAGRADSALAGPPNGNQVKRLLLSAQTYDSANCLVIESPDGRRNEIQRDRLQ